VGRLATCSLYYDDLVLTHISLQLEHALDILLEMYTTMAMHKCWAVIQACWDPKGEMRKMLQHLLEWLKQTLHGRLEEPHICACFQVDVWYGWFGNRASMAANLRLLVAGSLRG
jgi:hypothetical protein